MLTVPMGAAAGAATTMRPASKHATITGPLRTSRRLRPGTPPAMQSMKLMRLRPTDPWKQQMITGD